MKTATLTDGDGDIINIFKIKDENERQNLITINKQWRKVALLKIMIHLCLTFYFECSIFFFCCKQQRRVFSYSFLQCMLCGVNKTVYYCFQWMILLNQKEYIVNKSFLADLGSQFQILKTN